MRIAIIGAHGTGKSTLLNALLERQEFENYQKITEIARSVITEMGVNPSDMSPDTRDKFQTEIYRKQIEAEGNNKDYISDRSILDILSYTRGLPSFEWMSKEVYADIHRAYDMVIYCPIEFALADDGVRYKGDEYQREIDRFIFKNALAFVQHKLVIAHGTVEERVQRVMDGYTILLNKKKK